ncbi:hypothetical protein [Chloroflexus sp.]|uniref:hypothetical protein n=1 Tax=Chloroflexus sp. TaxID=1904827 RepID=UPI002ACE59E4|nr:hypothetical protein [Chloroflexus sp.]
MNAHWPFIPLWQRLTRYFSRGQSTLMLAAYTMINFALVAFILFHRNLSLERFYPVVLLLSVLLALNAAWEGWQRRWGEAAANRFYFAASITMW